MIAVQQDVLDDWARIAESDCPIAIETREQPLAMRDIDPLLAKAPFTDRAEGSVREVRLALAHLPASLRTDITALAERFMALMQVDAVRVRVEGIVTNDCKKIHTDFTDVRLITTYAGQGTEYAPHGDANCCLERVPTGAVALLKGRSFATGHAPCFHRSPPIEGTGDAPRARDRHA